MTVQNNDLLFFCYRVFPEGPAAEWKGNTLARWNTDLQGQIFQDVQTLNNEVTWQKHFTKFKDFEQQDMVELSLVSFAYLGLRSFKGQPEVPVFGGMGRGHKCLFTFVDQDNNEVEDLNVAQRIVGWKAGAAKVAGCFDRQAQTDLMVDQMEKDFGSWMGSLIKALDFDPGVEVRGENSCWIRYEVLEPLQRVAPDGDLAALGQTILSSNLVGANGRGSSDR